MKIWDPHNHRASDVNAFPCPLRAATASQSDPCGGRETLRLAPGNSRASDVQGGGEAASPSGARTVAKRGPEQRGP